MDSLRRRRAATRRGVTVVRAPAFGAALAVRDGRRGVPTRDILGAEARALDWLRADSPRLTARSTRSRRLRRPRLAAAIEVLAAAAVLMGAAPASGATYVCVASASAITQYEVGTSGGLTPLTPRSVEVKGGVFELAAAPNGRSLYAAGRGFVAQFDIGTDGRLSAKSPPYIPTPDNTFGVAANPRGDAV